MKRIFVIFLLSVILFSGCLSNMQFAEKYDISEKQIGYPELSNVDSWSIIVVPDTQNYVRVKENQKILNEMTNWIYDNVKNLNVQLVLSTGDLVAANLSEETGVLKGNQTSEQQWQAFADAFSVIWNTVPFVPCIGEHDMGYRKGESRSSQLNNYYNSETSDLINPAKGGILKEMWDDPVNGKSLQNAYYEFTAPTGKKFFLTSLEFGPRHEAVQWSFEMLSKKDYRESSGIFLTHGYMGTGAGRVDDDSKLSPENYSFCNDCYNAKELWLKYIRPLGCYNFVLSGHYAKGNGHRDHVGFRVDRDLAGRTVNQMLFNAEKEGGVMGNGGDGWLRILEFLPDNRTVLVKTYSPYLRKWRTSVIDNFTIRY